MRWGSSVRPGEGSSVLTSTYRRRWSNLRDYFNGGSDRTVRALIQALFIRKRDIERNRTQNGIENDDVAGNMRMTDRLAIFLANNIFRNQEARWCRQQVPSDVYFQRLQDWNYYEDEVMMPMIQGWCKWGKQGWCKRVYVLISTCFSKETRKIQVMMQARKRDLLADRS